MPDCRNLLMFSIGMFLAIPHAASAKLMVGRFLEPRSAYVSANLEISDRERIRKTNPDAIIVYAGAPKNLFEKPCLSSNLLQASLRNVPYCANYLVDLANNYPRLQNLVLIQENPLQDNEVVSIASLHHLKQLELHCPVKASRLDLPRTLEFLKLDQPALLSDFPKLRELELNKCKITEDYVSSLRLPNLRHLSLIGVTIGKNALEPLLEFRDLRDLDLGYSMLDEPEDLVRLEDRAKFKISPP